MDGGFQGAGCGTMIKSAIIPRPGNGSSSRPTSASAKLTIYATNGSGDVKRLKGAAGCRLRIGDWRIIFIEDVKSITVIAVGNRKEIYD